MQVLAIGAHPDDIEIGCAGTLLRCKSRGDDVHICVLTDGDAGNGQYSSSNVGTIRRREALSAARTLGCQLHSLALPDSGCFDSLESRLLIVEVIRKVKPDFIVSHGLEDQHPDHVATAQLSWSSSLMATFSKIETNSPPVANAPTYFVMEPLMGLGFVPEIWVDISETLSTKRKALLEHKSQRYLYNRGNRIDVVEIIEATGRFRGLQCGVSFAESFREWKVWPRIRSERCLP